MEEEMESCELDGFTYTVVEKHHKPTRPDSVGSCFWECIHVHEEAKIADPLGKPRTLGCSCDCCGGSACDECIQGCDKCKNVLCPVCKDRHNNGLCD